jgi:mono/diheme cytochrome c family protein
VRRLITKARAVAAPRRPSLIAASLALVLTGCAPEARSALEDARAYRDDARERRESLEASIAAHDTPYGALRAMHYALSGEGLDSEADWDRLPELAPRVREVFVDGTDGEPGPIAETELASLDQVIGAGERAFDRYPAQIDLGLTTVRTRADAARMGLHVEDDGRVRGLVEAETASGWAPALTCSGCHGRFDGSSFRLAIPNERLAIGSPSWPLGTMDVTDDGIENPTRPSDLRPIALQARLHHTGNLANGRIARMVRIETLLITQQNERSRPSRTIVAAISLYLDSLADTLPALDHASSGAALFERACARCHSGEALAGPWVRVEEVGTDPMATTDGQRGTGGYRAPSLLGVIDRRAVLHDGSAADLRAVLQLDRSAHVGHAFGLELSRSEREAIVTFLAGAR